MRNHKYYKIQRDIFREESASTLIVVDPKELLQRRTNYRKIKQFNKLGMSKILIVEDDMTGNVRYVWNTPSYVKIRLPYPDPVSAVLWIIAIRKHYQMREYKDAIPLYEEIMSKPYVNFKGLINKILLSLPKNVVKLM